MVRTAVYMFALLVAACVLVTLRLLNNRRINKIRESQFVIEKPWEYPEPSPDRDFDLAKTETPKFRAFRYDYKRHVIDTRKLDADSWVILDKDWPAYHAAKVQRIAERGDKSVQTLPRARAAAYELCQDLCEFLSRRYPQVYRIERSQKDTQGWYGKGSVTRIEMLALGVSHDLTKEDPLTVAGLIQPTDINILMKDEDESSYHMVAMMLGIGGGQRIKDKLGLSLADLHFTGHVPHYKEQLQGPLDRYLSKLKVDTPIQRNTTAISIHDELHWPTIAMGPEDDWDPVQRGPGVGTPSYGKFNPLGPVNDISQLWFRQERQVLRRLPKSGAVVWMVHTYIEPLADVAQESGVPGRLASLVRSWEPELAAHKGRHMYEHVLLPYLDNLHKTQVETGVCGDGRLPSNFPY
ncbi:Fc.00g017500.m01.CDS01 [Cosmosporella sp. VM-42]